MIQSAFSAFERIEAPTPMHQVPPRTHTMSPGAPGARTKWRIARWTARMRRALVPALLGAGFVALPFAAVPQKSNLPDLGNAHSDMLSPAEERVLGEAFLRHIQRNLPLVDDPEIVDYLDALGQRIARADPSRTYRFLMVDSAAVNAFAGPSGVIIVNAGLVLIAESESELAAVVGHEIAHITQMHLSRVMLRSQWSSLASFAAVIAGLFIATYNPTAGQATIAGGLAGAEQMALKYSRANESEADIAGMALLDRAGFDARAMPEFFQRFHDWQRFTTKPPEFLSTHPVTLSRVADTRALSERYPPRPDAGDNPAFHLMQAKLRVRLADRPISVFEDFDARIAAAGDEAKEADRYGRAIALAALNRREEAGAELEQLRRDFPDRAAHHIALADTYVANGEYERALTFLAEALERFPHQRGLVHQYGRTLIRVGRPDDAVPVLRKFLREHGSDSEIHRLLGQAHQQAGRIVASHLELAEFHIDKGDLRAAIRELDIALSNPDINEYQAASAQARREKLVELLTGGKAKG